MGSMKDQLGDDLPTIGDSRRQGMSTFSVHCDAPCGHVSKLTFDALRLPDETYFIDIPKATTFALLELRPARYGNLDDLERGRSLRHRQAARHGLGRGRESTRRRRDAFERVAVAGRAMVLAHDLSDKGDEVLRIEGPSGDVSAEDVAGERGEAAALICRSAVRQECPDRNTLRRVAH